MIKSSLISYSPKAEASDSLVGLNPYYKKYSEMSEEERLFLVGIIRDIRPKKVLEVGVSSGASSVILLNAILPHDGLLYSIDYLDKYYLDQTKKAGFVVDEYPSLKSNWKLYTGGLSYSFMNDIGGGIDFCFLDTVHANPGELLDFLMILPFLSDDAMLVMHDTNLQTLSGPLPFCDNVRGFTNNLLFSAITGTKYIQGNFSRGSIYSNTSMSTCFPNIAGIRLNSESKLNHFAVFNLLTLKWTYLLEDSEAKGLSDFFEIHYGPEFKQYFNNVLDYQKSVYQADQVRSKIEHSLINTYKKTVKRTLQAFHLIE